MGRALALAAEGDYRTAPNPKVGAVLVREGRVLAEGHHAQAGGPHAEAAAFAALRSAGTDARGATLYVTLEPCGPQAGKRTPPCVDAALAAGLARVVAATVDPHPEVAGRSLARLQAAGVQVEVGLLHGEARRLINPFTKWVTRHRPYGVAKWAMSLDGKIAAASGDSKWISSEASRRGVHVLRGEVDAVAVGIHTALVDDPLLTRRDMPGRDPLRVVFDARARLPLESRLVQTAREHALLVFVTAAAPADAVAALRGRDVEVVEVPAREGTVDPAAAFEQLAERDVRQVLIEGGGTLLASAFAEDLVDEVRCYVAPRILGGETAPGPVRGAGVARVADALSLVELTAEPSGPDVLLRGYVHVY